MKKFNILAIIAAVVLAFTVFSQNTNANTIPFTDVKAADQLEAITILYNEDIVFGATDTLFKPNAAATRGETAQMIVNALNWQGEDATNPGFTDVSGKYANAVYILANKEIVKIPEDGKFKPNGTLTRSQISKMLTLAFNLEQSTKTTSNFIDVKKDKLGAETVIYINTLVDYEITKGTAIKGTNDVAFNPNKSMTRGQLALFLKRSIDAVDNADDSEDFEIIGIE